MRPRYGNRQHRLHGQTGGPPTLRSLPLPTLLQGIQGAVSLTFDHLEDVCVRSLTKAVQAKVKIRKSMLGAIKPHTLQDPLLQSDLLHPEIFPPSALDTALPIFKTSLDTSSLRDHVGRLPFQAPRSGLDQGFVPRCRRSRRGSNRDPRSLPAPTSTRPPSTSDELRGRGPLRQQVADLQSQISTTTSPSLPAPRVRVVALLLPGTGPLAGAVTFFGGTLDVPAVARAPRSSSEPSNQPRGSRGRLRH